VCAPTTSRRRGFSLPDDCLFCTLAREGDHVAKADGFVAIEDINPKADVHLLVVPERHLETFRDIGELTADESKRMLDCVAGIPRARLWASWSRKAANFGKPILAQKRTTVGSLTPASRRPPSSQAGLIVAAAR